MNNQKTVQNTVSPDSGQLQFGCVSCADQCFQILEMIPADLYAVRVGENASIGTHMRHILDRFHCFFRGINTGAIDYDKRSRDPEIEVNMEAARFSVASFQKRFAELQQETLEQQIQVREAVHADCQPVIASSTGARELMGLITHSVHHLAIIVLLLRAEGIRIHPDFGKAPSTLIYERG